MVYFLRERSRNILSSTSSWRHRRYCYPRARVTCQGNWKNYAAVQTPQEELQHILDQSSSDNLTVAMQSLSELKSFMLKQYKDSIREVTWSTHLLQVHSNRVSTPGPSDKYTTQSCHCSPSRFFSPPPFCQLRLSTQRWRRWIKLLKRFSKKLETNW